MASYKKYLNILTYDFLYENYIVKKRSSRDIAGEVKCTPKSICDYLRYYKIKVRTNSEVHMGLGAGKKNYFYGKNLRGKNHPNWKGGIQKSGKYIYIYAPNHPNATMAGRVVQHRLFMEEVLGRYLTMDEQIHHINEDTHDNSIDNLLLLKSSSIHSKLHSHAYRYLVKMGIEKEYIKEFLAELEVK